MTESIVSHYYKEIITFVLDFGFYFLRKSHRDFIIGLTSMGGPFAFPEESHPFAQVEPCSPTGPLPRPPLGLTPRVALNPERTVYFHSAQTRDEAGLVP